MNMCSENHSSVPEFPGFPNCFVCGSENPRGLHTSFHSEGDGVLGIFNPDKTLVGFDNIVHGGVISALLDEAMIWACFAKVGRFGVTAELNVRFIRSMPEDDTYRVMGRMVQDIGKLWIAEGKIVDSVGRKIAEAKGKIFPKN